MNLSDVQSTKLTVFQPAYRVERWQHYINSIKESCTRYNYEVVFCGPNKPTFDLPDNVKFIFDEGSPARCANIACLASTGNLVLLGSDDATFYPNELDNLLDFWHLNKKDNFVMPIKYGEANTLMAEEYWYMHFHPPLRLPGIPYSSRVFLNFLSTKDFWVDVGGYDCTNFNTCNWGGHDITLRLYNLNTEMLYYPKHIMMCDWEPGSKSHSPIRTAEEGDYIRFRKLWMNVNKERTKIDINNYKLVDNVWPFARLRQ